MFHLESGLVVFKLIDGYLSHTNVQLEVLVDDHMFPSYTSMKIKSRDVTFEDGKLRLSMKIRKFLIQFISLINSLYFS